MINVLRFVLILLFFGICPATYAQIGQKVDLKVTDEEQQPLYGVYVIHLGSHTLLTTTDEKGQCSFSAGLQDSVQFACLGFANRFFTVRELSSLADISLKREMFYLDEVLVRSDKPQVILEKAAEMLGKHSRDIGFRHYGNGQYEKITECRQKAVEYRREYGCYLSRGIVRRLGVLDIDGENQFIPAYVQRSYNLTPDGRDSLYPLYNQGESSRTRYNASQRKVFILMRAIQLYGPLFSGCKYYDFHLVSDSADYVFTFQTRQKYYPDKSYIWGKGTCCIDRDSYRLKSMSFDYLDYQFYRLYRYRNKRLKSPFSTKVTLVFDYTPENVCYVQSCVAETFWKCTPDKEYHAGELPSRRNPGRYGLVEKEAFLCHSFHTMQLAKAKQFQNIFIYAGTKMKGKYFPEVWKRIPEVLDAETAKRELNAFMDLEKQFQAMSDKSYLPEDYYQRGYSLNYPLLDRYRNIVLQAFFKEIK